jgi:hypothetical protein
MRVSLLLAPLALISAPTLAQQTTARAAPSEQIVIPPELADPQMADRLADMMQVLSKALLNLPAGELKAAVEGRKPTTHDKGVTIRDLGRRENPDFERDLERQIAEARPMIRHSMKALAEALPAMVKGLSEAAREMEKATANLPDPTYPKR